MSTSTRKTTTPTVAASSADATGAAGWDGTTKSQHELVRSLKEAAREFVEMTGWQGKIIFLPAHVYDAAVAAGILKKDDQSISVVITDPQDESYAHQIPE